MGPKICGFVVALMTVCIVLALVVDNAGVAVVVEQMLYRQSHWVVGRSCSGVDFHPAPRLKSFSPHPPTGHFYGKNQRLSCS